MTEAMPLIVTRPEPGNAATVERARSLGLDAYAVPLFAGRAIDWQMPATENFDALLLTSAAAPASRPHPEFRPAYIESVPSVMPARMERRQSRQDRRIAGRRPLGERPADHNRRRQVDRRRAPALHSGS